MLTLVCRRHTLIFELVGKEFSLDSLDEFQKALVSAELGLLQRCVISSPQSCVLCLRMNDHLSPLCWHFVSYDVPQHVATTRFIHPSTLPLEQLSRLATAPSSIVLRRSAVPGSIDI